MGRAAALDETGASLLAAYRELLPEEARLAAHGARLRSSLADSWPVLEAYLARYAPALSPAGVLVLGGGPDEGSRHTGVPFAGATAARDRLDLHAEGDVPSPAEGPFWDAVALASPAADHAALDALFSTIHLAHARPFDAEATPEVRDACARHVLRLLHGARPQAIVAVGHEALHVVARALQDTRVLDVAAIPEKVWTLHWPPGTPLLRYPYVEVPAARPFRACLVPVPDLAGPYAADASQALAGVLAGAWAG